MVAREQASDYSQNRGGLQGETKPLIVYTTEEAHSPITKAALLAGYGLQNLRKIDMDPTTRTMSSQALTICIEQDLANGCQSAVIVASVGSTGVTAVDPVARWSR